MAICVLFSFVVFYLCGKEPINESACDLMHRINSPTAVFETQLIFNFSLIAFPNFASATRSCSCASFATNFFKSFLKGFATFPSTAAVAAPSASVVSVNFSKCFSLTLKQNKCNCLIVKNHALTISIT